MNLAIFSHGKESGPTGQKITRLRKVAESNGFETISIDYTQCKDANERVQLLKKHLTSSSAEIIMLIGSSMGGYVSTSVANDHPIAGLFLLCPALWMPGEEYEVQTYQPQCEHIEIIHGWNDDIVPFENSIRFGQQTKAVVNLIDDDHRLKNSYEFMEHRFDDFISRMG